MLLKVDASWISNRFAEYTFKFLCCVMSCNFGMEHAETLV